MNTILLRVLRADAKAWWAHKALRQCGRIQDALLHERRSICQSAKTLRVARDCPDTYVSTGRGGTSVHYWNGTRYAKSTVSLSHPGGIEHLTVARVLIAMGKPFINTRSVSDPIGLIALPLIACGKEPDPAPRGAMHYAPLAEYCRRAQKMGAHIFNAPALPSQTHPEAA